MYASWRCRESKVEPLVRLTAVAAPLIRPNVDTDAIIPSREMKAVSKTGLAEGLFAGWRYLTPGGRDANPDFVLNQPQYAGVKILLGGENFGCGSSREHAVWALHEFGFRAIIAPSFSPIFRNNCVRNGIAPLVLPAPQVAALAHAVAADPQGKPLTIDVAARLVIDADGNRYAFEIGEEAREMLLEGADVIDLTLKLSRDIAAFRARDREARPWAHLDSGRS